MLKQAEADLPALVASDPRLRFRFVYEGLQDWTPEPGLYDCIWVQWVIGHLTDRDMVAFLRRALAGLREGGFVVLKENTCREGFVVDKEDSSLTRSDAYFRQLFVHAGVRVASHAAQREFPKELFKVMMYALQPAAEGEDAAMGDDAAAGRGGKRQKLQAAGPKLLD